MAFVVACLLIVFVADIDVFIAVRCFLLLLNIVVTVWRDRSGEGNCLKKSRRGEALARGGGAESRSTRQVSQRVWAQYHGAQRVQRKAVSTLQSPEILRALAA